MNASSRSTVTCRVVGGEQLPSDSGGSDALCAAIERAASAQAPGRAFTVDVAVKGPSALSARLTTADGKQLPEQTMSISDRALTRGSLERFASTLVGEMVRTASR